MTTATSTSYLDIQRALDLLKDLIEHDNQCNVLQPSRRPQIMSIYAGLQRQAAQVLKNAKQPQVEATQ